MGSGGGGGDGVLVVILAKRPYWDSNGSKQTFLPHNTKNVLDDKKNRIQSFFLLKLGV